MSHIDDVVTGGILPLQHHDTDYELPLRVVKYGARYGGKSASKKDTIVKGTAGDLLGGILWPHEPGSSANAIATGGGPGAATTTPKTKREIPAWGFGFPAITVAASRAVGKVFRVRVRPIGDVSLAPDRRFKVLDVLTPSACASGSRGVLMAVTEEYSQIEVFLPSQSSLVAAHYNGPGSSGSLVHDLDGAGNVDPDVAATLQHLGRVYQVPDSCAPYGEPGKFGLAIQVGQARGGQRGGVLADGNELAGLMHSLGGAFHLGIGASDKHYHGKNSKGETANPVHMNTKVPWIKPRAKGAESRGGTQERGGTPSTTSKADEVQDGPLKFTDEEVKNVNALPGVDVETRLVYDPVSPHDTPCGPRAGLWKWVTRVPFYQPPPPTEDHGKPKKPKDPRKPEKPNDPGKPGGGGDDGPTDGPTGGGNEPGEPIGDPVSDPEGGGTGAPSDPGTGGFVPAKPKPDPDDGEFPLINVVVRFGPNGQPLTTPLSPEIEDRGDPEIEDREDGPIGTGDPTGEGQFPLVNVVVQFGPDGRPRTPTRPRTPFGDTDPCRKRPVSMMNELAVPAMSYLAQDSRPRAKEYLYARGWTQADAARESRTRPTVLRTHVVSKNRNGAPTLTRKAPCPYPGGTASGWVVDYPPEESPTDGPMAGGSSTSGRAACRTKTGHGCPNDDGTFTGYTTDNVAGVLTIDLVTSDVTTGTAKLELGPGYLKLNGTAFAAGGLSLFFGDAEDDGVYV